MKGRRLPDTILGQLPDDLQPGDYWKVTNSEGEPIHVGPEKGNLTGTVWGIYCPRGGVGTLWNHTVREHEDGTISVRPGDGSSNSILMTGGPGSETWHGYIEQGEWREL